MRGRGPAGGRRPWLRLPWIALAAVVFLTALRTPAQRALGTDVSMYQGSGINWPALKTDGITFAWVECTKSTNLFDPDFTLDETNAKAAGIPIGAYHYAHPESNAPAAEAAYYWSMASNYVKADNLTLMPMLDMEVFTGLVGAGSYTAWANLWCSNIVKCAASNGVAIRPAIYVSACNADNFNSGISNWIPWIADYSNAVWQTGTPWSLCLSYDAWGGGQWTVWQYADTNWSGGDADVFNGTAAQMTATLVAPASPVAAAGSLLYWNPGFSNAAPGSGGTAAWNTNSAFWWPSGTTNYAWPSGGARAVFGGTAGAVNLTTGITASSLTFQTTGYMIGGAGQTLSLSSPAVISAGSGSVSFNCILGGAGFTVEGGGSVTLSNPTNTTSSAISVLSNTTLVIPSAGAISSGAGTVTLAYGGILQDTDPTNGDAFLKTGLGISLGVGTQTLSVPGAGTLSLPGTISGAGNLAKTGAGGLLLQSAETFTGATLINQGTLGLGSAASLNSSSSVTIAAGAMLDVSASSAWTMGGGVLIASGTGSAVGSTAAALKGAAGGTVGFGSQPVSLNFSPTAFNGDSTHPALFVSQGALTLNTGNAITITNLSGTPLGVGTYALMVQSSGTIAGTPNPTPAIFGAGLASGTVAALAVNGANLNLVVQTATSTTVNPLTPITYGQAASWSASVAPAPPGGTVRFFDNGAGVGGPVPVSGGQAAVVVSNLAAGSHLVTAAFSGYGTYAASAASGAVAQVVNPLPVYLTGSRVYDGTTAIAAPALTVSNTVASDTVSVASGAGSLTGSSVGTWGLSSVGTLALGGASAADYTLTGAAASVGITVPSFAITSAVLDVTGGNLIITWQSAPGGVYQLLGAASVSGPFTNIGPAVTASSTITSVTNPVTGSAAYFELASP